MCLPHFWILVGNLVCAVMTTRKHLDDAEEFELDYAGSLTEEDFAILEKLQNALTESLAQLLAVAKGAARIHCVAFLTNICLNSVQYFLRRCCRGGGNEPGAQRPSTAGISPQARGNH